MSKRLHKIKWSPWITVSKTANFCRIGWTLSRNRDAYVSKNEHVYAICYRPEVAGGVIAGGNVQTIEGYAVLNVEAARLSSFQIKSKSATVKRIDDGRPLEPNFLGQGEQMSNRLRKRKWSPWITVSKTLNFWESVEPLSTNPRPNMTENELVYAICCRPEAAGDTSFAAKI